MRILLLTAYFPPDIGSASHLFYELGKALIKRGHEVIAITSVPSYFAKGDLKKYQRKMWVTECFNQIHVIRITVPNLPRHIPLARAIWQFSIAAIFAIPLLFIKKTKAMLVYSPPLTLGLTSWMISAIRGIPFILNVQDLFPQSVIDLDILKNKFLNKIFEAMEKFIYKRASFITVHSSGNKEHMIMKGVDTEKILVVHNWADTEFLKPGSKENSFSKQYNLNSKFVVSFAGVLGYSQDIDIIIESAKQLESYKDIKFLIVGDGIQKPRILQKSKELNVKNVIFLPMQPRVTYPQILHASDVSLSSLNSSVKTPVVPSKILSIMAAGKPVIALMDLSGDAPKIINNAKCGFALSSEDPGLLAESILKLYKNPELCERYGKNGRDYVEKHFSLNIATESYEKIFKEITIKN